MELNDLKKSWSTLNKQLQEREIVDEKQIEILIAKYQSTIKKGLTWLSDIQKISLIVGIAAACGLAVALVIHTRFFTVMHFSAKEIVMASYVTLTLLGGFFWDWQTYAFSRSIRVYEMPTVEVIRIVNKFKEKIKFELIIVCIWLLIFISLYFWVQEYYNQPLTVQLAFVLGSLTLVGVAMFLLYKKVFYQRLNDIEKNLKELKEIQTSKSEKLKIEN